MLCLCRKNMLYFSNDLRLGKRKQFISFSLLQLRIILNVLRNFFLITEEMLAEEKLGNIEKYKNHPLTHKFSGNFIKLEMPGVAKNFLSL